MSDEELYAFVKQSNAIEGITRDPRVYEIQAHETLLVAPAVTVELLVAFVSAIQPGAVLRDRVGLNVRVGSHYPPPGSPDIHEQLYALLDDDGNSPWQTHVDYERLHPFTDGNGRSGRALWLWMMQRNGLRVAPLSFLHSFYYQTLAGSPMTAPSEQKEER